ncbi:MAG: PP2C family serine/threonine-protein phosphatase [Desulfococcaceae bacterium]|jgi:hypothetical protein|nr:PP2C family serine/threonine-protein phosphatase [Desulfococcaceae bacterium]
MSEKKQKTPWRVIGTSVKGTKHLDMDTPCQDAFYYKVLESGTIIISVSDGAGSVPKAQEGSLFISENSVTFLEKHILGLNPHDKKTWKKVFRSAFQETRKALQKYASDSASALYDYAATLMLTVITENFVIGGLIGDCAAVVCKKNGELGSLCKAQKGEYANMTNFLTQKDAMSKLDIRVYQDSVQGISLISDGLSELALNISDNIPCSVFFHPFFNFARAVTDEYETQAETKLAAFLDSDRVNARTDDDKTLVIAVKRDSDIF